MAPKGSRFRRSGDGYTEIIGPWRAVKGKDPDTLPGPHLPMWQCRCGEERNHANRLFCRVCDDPAPFGVQQRAKREADKRDKAKAELTNGKQSGGKGFGGKDKVGGGGGEKGDVPAPWKSQVSAKDKEIAELKKQLAAAKSAQPGQSSPTPSEGTDEQPASESTAAASVEATELKEVQAQLAHLRKSPYKPKEITDLITTLEARQAILQGLVDAARPPEQQIKATEKKVKAAEAKLAKAKQAQVEAEQRKEELEKEVANNTETIKTSKAEIVAAEGEVAQLKSLLAQHHRKAGTSQGPAATVQVSKGTDLAAVIKDWAINQPVDAAKHPELVTRMGEIMALSTGVSRDVAAAAREGPGDGDATGVHCDGADIDTDEVLDDAAFDMDPEEVRKTLAEAGSDKAAISDDQARAFQSNMRALMRKKLADRGGSLRIFRSKALRK